jgi:tetrahydromethanopterin S-methyltransferase subunit G
MRKHQDTPPFDNGQTILKRLDALGEKLETAVQKLNGRLDGLETKMNDLQKEQHYMYGVLRTPYV